MEDLDREIQVDLFKKMTKLLKENADQTMDLF